MKRSFRMRMATWFSLSVVGISIVLFVVTYFHLRHELSFQRWERNYLEHHDYITHGRYSQTEIDDIAGHVIHISLLMSVPFVLLAIGIGWYLANKSLKPISDINQQLTNIHANRLDLRIHTPEAASELDVMTGNINSLLSRIEESYRDMSEFSARVAHELKTPLTLMRLKLEESAQTTDPEMSEFLQDELMRLEGYVQQCLLVARAERGQIEAKRQPLILKSLLEDVLEPFCLLAKEDGRDILFVADVVDEVVSDPWILRQILHNLLSNALKHGEGNISVKLEKDSEEQSSIVIQNRKKTTESRSTGMGLRIVEALVKTHGNLEWEWREEPGEYYSLLRWVVE